MGRNFAKAVDAALNTALEFYATHGFDMEKPRIVIMPTCNKVDSGVYGHANLEKHNLEKLAIGYRNESLQLVMSNRFGLRLSTQALSELLPSKIGSDLPELQKEFADIVLFKNAREIFYDDSDLLEALLAHELWHLKEEQAGLCADYPLIYEGLADFAYHEYLGEPYGFEEVSCFEDVLYDRVASIVAGEVSMWRNKLEAMLIPKKRESINRKAKIAIRSYMNRAVIMGKDLPYIHNLPNSLEDLRSNTKSQLLDILNSRGAYGAARELGSQDLSRFLTAWMPKS